MHIYYACIQSINQSSFNVMLIKNVWDVGLAVCITMLMEYLFECVYVCVEGNTHARLQMEGLAAEEVGHG